MIFARIGSGPCNEICDRVLKKYEVKIKNYYSESPELNSTHFPAQEAPVKIY